MPDRYCYWHDESYQDPDTNEFFVARIEEGKPGYWRVGEANERTTESARRMADGLNERLGLTADDVYKIRLSSMSHEVINEHFDG